jgi:hydroxymethylpyrimidine kinase / phosphomethylpyrimidine kinase / thiamine-phosphate diphosphorylase
MHPRYLFLAMMIFCSGTLTTTAMSLANNHATPVLTSSSISSPSNTIENPFVDTRQTTAKGQQQQPQDDHQSTNTTAVATAPTTMTVLSRSLPPPRPVVYTIAGSDSGGGAGIQADLLAIHAMKCHGCSAITCLTAQNSQGVTAVHVPPTDFLRQQLETLWEDMPPRAIKIGMLATPELAQVVGKVLKRLLQTRTSTNQIVNYSNSTNTKIWIVLDPVMVSTSGSRLLQDDAIDAMMEHVFPLADVVTPNKFEAETLLGRTLSTPSEVEQGARELLRKLKCRSVLIKGGHTLVESSSSSSSSLTDAPAIPSVEVQSTFDFALDYLLSSDAPVEPGKLRLCDPSQGVWLRTPRWDSDNTHGTGCTLSTAIASALALGEENRQSTQRIGSQSSIQIVDACCLAKAYVSAGIQQGTKYGSGPGPVAQTEFPSSYLNFPSIVKNPSEGRTGNNNNFAWTNFRPVRSMSSPESSNPDISPLGRLLPIVDTVEWVDRLSKMRGITDIQLRIKDVVDPKVITERVRVCQEICSANGVRLWINDHWEASLQAGCFGVHIGQEDLFQCMNAGGLEKLKSSGMALGISTHSYGELAVALGVKPSYISMGPVFATSSKDVAFDPQGLETVKKWRQLIPPLVPLVTIGGINDITTAKLNQNAGSDCIAVISAITHSPNPSTSVAELNDAMI